MVSSLSLSPSESSASSSLVALNGRVCFLTRGVSITKLFCRRRAEGRQNFRRFLKKQTSCFAWCHACRSTYSAINHLHVNIRLFGPFVPEVGVIQRDVCAVSGSNKTGLNEDIKIRLIHNQIGLSSSGLHLVKYNKLPVIPLQLCLQWLIL